MQATFYWEKLLIKLFASPNFIIERLISVFMCIHCCYYFLKFPFKANNYGYRCCNHCTQFSNWPHIDESKTKTTTKLPGQKRGRNTKSIYGLYRMCSKIVIWSHLCRKMHTHTRFAIGISGPQPMQLFHWKIERFARLAISQRLAWWAGNPCELDWKCLFEKEAYERQEQWWLKWSQRKWLRDYDNDRIIAILYHFNKK